MNSPLGNLVPQLVEVLRGMWRGRWLGLAAAWLTAIAGTVFVLVTPDRYEATARVYVDTQTLLKPLLHGLTVQLNVEQEVAMLSRTLISRPNLEKLVRMSDLDLKAASPQEREKVLDKLSRTVYIKSAAGQNLYTIGFTDPDPRQATRVVQSLLSIFVESGLAPKAQDTGQAQRFIEEQIKQYEQRLTEAENRLKEFKLRNLDLGAVEGRDFFGNITSVQQQLREARSLLEEAEKSRDTLKQQIVDANERPPQLFGTLADQALVITTPELDSRLATLSKNLDELLMRYTENHPDVVNTRRMINEVETQREEERKRLGEEHEKRLRATASSGNFGNPMYPQLKLAMAESEAQVARLRARVREQEQRLAQLQAAARSVPEREAQLAQLNRDYAIQKQNYEALVARREAALISGDLQAATGVARFRIIDPPQASSTPVAPNRKTLALAALVASILSGLAASYLFSVVYPTFQDIRGLRRATQRPILGTVSLIRTTAVLARARRHALAFAGGIAALATTYGAALAAVFLRPLLPF